MISITHEGKRIQKGINVGWAGGPRCILRFGDWGILYMRIRRFWRPEWRSPIEVRVEKWWT